MEAGEEREREGRGGGGGGRSRRPDRTNRGYSKLNHSKHFFFVCVWLNSESNYCKPPTLNRSQCPLQTRHPGFENVTSTLTIINAMREKLIKGYNLIANLSLHNVKF